MYVIKMNYNCTLCVSIITISLMYCYYFKSVFPFLIRRHNNGLNLVAIPKLSVSCAPCVVWQHETGSEFVMSLIVNCI